MTFTEQNMDAGGSFNFIDTHGYHTALKDGEARYVHMVAALTYEQVTK